MGFNHRRLGETRLKPVGRGDADRCDSPMVETHRLIGENRLKPVDEDIVH